MADFYQNEIITTLHNLTSRHLADLESDLLQFKKQRPIGLLLPPLYSELEGEALPNDVVLITYGSSIKKPAEAPLKTLVTFSIQICHDRTKLFH